MIRLIGPPPPPVVMECPSSPEQRAAALAERERYHRNVRWFADHAADIGREHAGKFICVAGQELFVGTDPNQVHADASAKHPQDRGSCFCKLISTHRGPKIYANRRHLAPR
jgi:hypothetical protein